MQNDLYSKDLENAVKFRAKGIWIMARDTLSAETARFLEAELARTLAQRPMIDEQAGYYTTDVIMTLGCALDMK